MKTVARIFHYFGTIFKAAFLIGRNIATCNTKLKYQIVQ